MTRRYLASLVIVVLDWCGCGGGDGDDCLDLARQYANELPNALACDPTSPADQCSDSVNTASYEVNGQQMTLQGLGACMHSANPARDGKLKQILSEYIAGGCRIAPPPVCPGVFDRCYVDPQGNGACFE